MHWLQASGTATREVTLVAVSKTKPMADIVAAHAAGQRHFGENYVRHQRRWHDH